MSVKHNDICDARSNNILLTIKDTKLYDLVVTLSAKDNKKLSKLLNRVFEISVYWNKYKTKSDNKNITNVYRYFLESKFVGVNRLLAFIHSNEDDNAKRYKAKRCYLPKRIIKIYNVIISGNNFLDQPNDSDTK